ncbi:hydroxyisourate hydrolase [Acinetobacter lactucae]|uniref:hydroxyisourate hydrolase n=1 Tax=Acinetobacter lactucae TaxID=1785128 RepID=UPI0015804B5B|nr:hydroxyisourate hydrolase [Acinetobacter lactucae]NUF14684.1 hydroxyisourate hydrolase [Acinetobacter lactucae]
MISTHILDTNLGKPAADVEVKLFHAATHELIATATTNQDGRVSDFGIKGLGEGAYQLEFKIAPYFSSQQVKTFFPLVCIQFFIEDASQHYHIPLLISPFAYSTYRGS